MQGATAIDQTAKPVQTAIAAEKRDPKIDLSDDEAAKSHVAPEHTKQTKGNRGGK
jgi:hypothetical protein